MGSARAFAAKKAKMTVLDARTTDYALEITNKNRS
jgi:hypothetical protein